MRNFIAMDFAKPHTFLTICIIAPFIGGLISIWLGADTNWDLANYHLYNPFAFLHQKLMVDLAPAGLQTYFNPILDIPYYWMANHLSAVLVGFIMGFIHSANFILVALVARQLLNKVPAEDKYKIPMLLALFGCLTANFSSAFGNTMGDIVTASFVLSSLLIILHALNVERHSKIPVKNFLFAGAFAGIAVGLKLTNAVFAVALCASIFILPMTIFVRLKLAFIFGIAVLVGTTITAGYWFYEMWTHFGNPLFPQFSKFFPNELTQDISIADVRWGPRSITEALLWPIIMSLNPLRVGELKHHQIIWAIFYVGILLWTIRIVWMKAKKIFLPPLSISEKFLLFFICTSFLVWLKIFSIQRYLVAIEILLPLAIFLILTHIFSYELARKYSLRLLSVITLIIYLAGAKTWGHADWSEKMYRVDVPALTTPEKTTVIMVAGDPPFGWLISQFPSSVAFVQISGSFPANMSVYSKRIDQIIDSRKGQVFALFPDAPDSERFKRAEKANAFFEILKITQSAKGCDSIKKIIPIFKLEKKVQVDMNSADQCHLTAIHLDKDTDQINILNEGQAVQALANYGYVMDLSSCQTHQASIGQKSYKYRWCALSKHL